ncbi:MAG TPA: substrate-binding domain-containing protein [Casimicrobiaceae bacterium]|jgi:putative molybdopterin biosynthesis protein
MAKIDIAVAWLAGERARASPLLLKLLRAIRDLGSIQRASTALGISYRNGWGLLESWRDELGRPLIDKTRGRGTRLTDLGEALLRCDNEVRAALVPYSAALRERLDRELGFAASGPGRLTISASHDLALAAVRDAVARAGIVQLDVQFRGSMDSIEALLADRCELAGFHIDGHGGADLVAPYRRLLHSNRHAIIRFVERRQGLLVTRGNPLGIRMLTDLTGGPRLINRQPGSGTRLLFDRLLRAAKIQPVQIIGYDREEFTHLAVAATVAAGQADVGFGIEAAAAQYRLDFVPLATEQYALALRRDQLRDPRVLALVDFLGEVACRNLIAALPGYRAARSGEVIGVNDFLPAPRPAKMAPPSRRKKS